MLCGKPYSENTEIGMGIDAVLYVAFSATEKKSVQQKQKRSI